GPGTIVVSAPDHLHPAQSPYDADWWFIEFTDATNFTVSYESMIHGEEQSEGTGSTATGYSQGVGALTLPPQRFNGPFAPGQRFAIAIVKPLAPGGNLAVAWFPGMVNSQYGNGIVATPDPFGPRGARLGVLGGPTRGLDALNT